jgi:hypothetical protein
VPLRDTDDRVNIVLSIVDSCLLDDTIYHPRDLEQNLIKFPVPINVGVG